MANTDGREPESSSSSDTELSSGGLNPEVDCSSSSSSLSRPRPDDKIGLFSWKRRRLSYSLSWKREPREGEEARISGEATKAEESETSIESNKWEAKDLISRDGKSKLRSEVFFASLDQRSEQAAGEAACAAVAVVMAHWLCSNPYFIPSAPKFDSIIIQGSSLWQSLCNDELYLKLFPNKHFDLETIVSANLRPIRVCPDKSFTGVFSPEKFDSLKGLMSFDEIWGEIEKDISRLDRGESRVYIMSWNDHFFVMRADLDGYYIIDSLGERLFEGCKYAYILKFDDSSLMYEKKVMGKSEEEGYGESPNSSSEEEEGKEEVEEETLVLKGKECCREYIKRFLAEITVAELAAEEKKGNCSSQVQHFIDALAARFSIKDLGDLSYFLGVEAKRTSHGLLLTQRKYIQDLLNRCLMHEAKTVPTPMPSSSRMTLDTGISLSNPTEYRSIVGGLQYLSLTRPDVSFAVNKLSQFMHAPTDVHWQAVKRVLRYLAGTKDRGIFLSAKNNLSLHAFTDADWAGDSLDLKSTGAYLLFLGAHPISWSSKKQTGLSRSSTEAEYRSIASTAAEVLWVLALLSEVGVTSSSPPTIYCDNIGATYLSAKPVFHSRMKHLALDYLFVRGLVESNTIRVTHVRAADQLADILTKPLSRLPFQLLCSKIGLTEGAPS